MPSSAPSPSAPPIESATSLYSQYSEFIQYNAGEASSPQVHAKPFVAQHQYYEPPLQLNQNFFKYPFANISENLIKECYFTEGSGLKKYIGTFFL